MLFIFKKMFDVISDLKTIKYASFFQTLVMFVYVVLLALLVSFIFSYLDVFLKKSIWQIIKYFA